MSDPVVEGLEHLISQSNIGTDYNEYRKTEDYENYYASIKHDKPTMSGYLIDLCIFGYWHSDIYQKKDGEIDILDQPEGHYKPVKGDIPSMIYSYPSMEEYIKESGVTPILTTGTPLTLEECREIAPHAIEE